MGVWRICFTTERTGFDRLTTKEEIPLGITVHLVSVYELTSLVSRFRLLPLSGIRRDKSRQQDPASAGV